MISMKQKRNHLETHIFLNSVCHNTLPKTRIIKWNEQGQLILISFPRMHRNALPGMQIAKRTRSACIIARNCSICFVRAVLHLYPCILLCFSVTLRFLSGFLFALLLTILLPRGGNIHPSIWGFGARGRINSGSSGGGGSGSSRNTSRRNSR